MGDMSPPWVLYLEDGRPAAILPAGRPGEVADVREWPKGLAERLVKAANQFHDLLVEAQLARIEVDVRRLVSKANHSGSDAALADAAGEGENHG